MALLVQKIMSAYLGVVMDGLGELVALLAQKAESAVLSFTAQVHRIIIVQKEEKYCTARQINEMSIIIN